MNPYEALTDIQMSLDTMGYTEEQWEGFNPLSQHMKAVKAIRDTLHAFREERMSMVQARPIEIYPLEAE